MATMERNVVVWSNAAGLPGVSVFYGQSGAAANAALKTFFTAVQSLFPAGLTWSIPTTGDTIDSTTGGLLGSWVNVIASPSVVASGAANYAAGCGAFIKWETGAIFGRRRLKGRTFMAPLINSAYDAGTILNSNLATLQTAASNLVTANVLYVWHRPGSSGSGAVAPTAATVPDQVTSLKTRRR